MSIEAAMSRIVQLQSMLAPHAPAPRRPRRPTSFSSALATATGTGAAPRRAGARRRPPPRRRADLDLRASRRHALRRGDHLRRAGQRLDPALLAGLIERSPASTRMPARGAGARGLTQLCPAPQRASA